MRIALLGGAGFIGPHVAAVLHALGHDAEVLSRRSGVDRNDPASVRRAVDGCDALVDLIAYDEARSRALLDALADWRGRYVLISSADVYRNYGGLQRKEDAALSDALLSETSPLRMSRYPYRGATPRAADDADAWQDAYDKIPIENAAREARPDAVIARLPMMYGLGDKQRRFGWITRALRRGDDIEAPRAWLNWRTSYGHVADVGAAIALLATDGRAAGETFNVGPRTTPAHWEWIELFGSLGEVRFRGEVRAVEDGPFAAAVAGLDLRFALALDTSKLHGLGYRERENVWERIRPLMAAESG